MEIYIDHQILEFENDPKNMEVIFNSINNHLNKTGLYISHFILDDKPVHDGFFNYVAENKNTIQKIEVITQTLNEGIAGSLRSTNDHITKLIPFCNELAKEFYEQTSDVSWLALIDLLENLECMIQTPGQLNSIITKDHSLVRYGAWKQFVQLISGLEEVVSKFEEVINSEDNEVTGDLLLNELIPLFKNEGSDGILVKLYDDLFIGER